MVELPQVRYRHQMASRPARPPAPAEHLHLVQQVVGLWVEMQARLQVHFAALAAEYSLSAVQAKVLVQLDANTAMTTRALAERLQYDPSNLTSVIDGLAARKLVERRPDPHDRRVKGLRLTAAGVRLRQAFWERLVNDTGPLGHLSRAELRQLREVLQAAVVTPSQPAPGVKAVAGRGRRVTR